MFTRLQAILLWAAAVLCVAQTSPSNKYQPATVTAVVPHQSGAGRSDNDVARYDVSVKVANTIYTVLYTPPNGANGVEYSAGLPLLVLVGNDTLTFNSKLSGKTEVPILHRETLPSQSGLDLSKIPSQYFSMKQEHLADTLDLTTDQQSKIKPILEQEAGEAGQVLGNPAISRKDQLNRWEKIVQSSDAKIQPVLSQAQVHKLQALRQEQKQELKKLIEDQKSSKLN